MQLWMVDPREMCDQHLREEHCEIHFLVDKQKITCISQRDNGPLITYSLSDRHYVIAAEMESRGMQHISPINPNYVIHLANNPWSTTRLVELHSLCENCQEEKRKQLKKALSERKVS